MLNRPAPSLPKAKGLPRPAYSNNSLPERCLIYTHPTRPVELILPSEVQFLTHLGYFWLPLGKHSNLVDLVQVDVCYSRQPPKAFETLTDHGPSNFSTHSCSGDETLYSTSC